METTNHQGAILIEELLQYARHHKILKEDDVVWTRNQLLNLLQVDEPLSEPDDLDTKSFIPESAAPILDKILDYCYEKGILEENTLTHRDLLDTSIMGVFLSKPSEVTKTFYEIKERDGIQSATSNFYHLCQKSNYIRMDRIQKNLIWNCSSPFGDLEITINLTKPEKDPKEIAALKNAPQSGYPKCMLCPENVGYSGRVNFPARQTHRTIPLSLNKETWYFQYSPYVYYNEHCIVLKEEHTPMKITRDTFYRLFDFLNQFPHYFIGSNADLPIVGGSILNHDHFQGGRYIFPMEKSGIEYKLSYEEDKEVEAAVVNWPMTVLRISSNDPDKLGDLAFSILSKWREYSDLENEIFAFSTDDAGNKIPHNTITPIARINQNGWYELDLVLRNNRTSRDHPLGIFHPHEDLHHIKKENIGLIEVMGLFILPGRLESELRSLSAYLTGQAPEQPDALNDPSHSLHHHRIWLNELIQKYSDRLSEEQAKSILKEEVGLKCQRVLADAGVFKTTAEGRAGFDRFLASVGFTHN